MAFVRVRFGQRYRAAVEGSGRVDRQQDRGSKSSRLDYFDSLRGIAAILVVLHHCYQTAPFWPSLVRFSPARLLLNGRSSVIFFFVLSGFVLAYGLWRGDQSTNFRTFVTRRLTRIYLPYAAAGLLAAAAMLALRPVPLASTAITFNTMWSAPLTWPSALAHLFLLGTDEADAINLPSWSLIYELRISLLVPLLCVCALVSARWLAVSTLAAYVLGALAMASMGLSTVPYAASGLLANVLVTLHFTADFVIGVLLAKAALARAEWLYAMSPRRKIGLTVAATALLFIFRDETAAVGSALVMILALNSPAFQRVLMQPFLLWIGRLSFSLYLTHMIVLQLVVRALHDQVPLQVSVFVALVAMLPVTILFFKAVEEPAACWSRRIGRAPRGAQAGEMAMGRLATRAVGLDALLSVPRYDGPGDLVRRVEHPCRSARPQRRGSSVAPGDRTRRDTRRLGGVDVADLVADCEHRCRRHATPLDQSGDLGGLSGQRGAAGEVSDTLAERRAENAAHVGLRVRADDGEDRSGIT